MTAPGGQHALLVLSDYADPRCGVGSSEAAVAAASGAQVEVLDPVDGSLWTWLRRAGAARRRATTVVVAYPTLAQVERVRLVPRLLALRLLLRGRPLRVHLHEFERLRRRHRIVVAAMVGVLADAVVVSSEREARALRERYRGWAGRAPVAVVPPANASAPAPGPAAVGEPEAGLIGLIGQHRPDKGEAWLFDALRRLDGRYHRLEVVGRGWDKADWPPDVRERFLPALLGEVPPDDLPAVVARWDLALAPFEEPPHDGRLSLRTPLAHGVPTLTRGPRPDHLRLAAPHLCFDDEVDVGDLPPAGAAARARGAAAIAELERCWRSALAAELFGP